MQYQRSNLVRIQVICWVVTYLFLIIYGYEKWAGDLAFVIASTTISVLSYIIIVYGQSQYLLPRFFEKGTYWQYGFYSALFLLGMVVLRMMAENLVLNQWLGHTSFYVFNWTHRAFAFVTHFLAWVFGILVRLSLNYLDLFKRQQQLQTQQFQAELNLLKSQVQPHFLFNTLNNIYSLAHRKSEKTTEMIARLSELMRYFLDEAPKEKVLLAVEIQFLKDYIELEKIRIPYAARLDFCVETDRNDVLVPPMLLMPLVETIFKHGLDRARPESWARIRLWQTNSVLHFETTNSLCTSQQTKKGLGLKNLRKRLEMLYADNYMLSTTQTQGEFRAKVEVPV